MKLRYISLAVQSLKDETKFYSEFSYKFNYNTRFICNYLSKSVRQLKIDTKKINMISVKIHPSDDTCQLIGNVLRINLRFTESDMLQLLEMTDLNARFECYLSLLEKGYAMAVNSGYDDICIVQLLALHRQFRMLKFKNEWIWKKMTLKGLDKVVIFKCNFTTFCFKYNFPSQ